MKTIFEDNRDIVALAFPEPNYEFLAVGENGITKIIPYLENGEMARITYFEIWKGESLSSRINGKYVREIHYKPQGQEEV